MRADFDAYIREHTTLRKKIAADFFSALKKRSAKSWKAVSRVERMSVFKEAVKSVPAYLKFLKAHNVRPSSIKSEDDFHSLPPMTKANYLRAFPLTERTVKNRTADTAPIVFTATSGSTGEPVYFPRNHILDLQSSMYHELIFRNAKISQGDSSLVVVAFGMGVWIGGIITYEAIKTMGERGYNVSVITPGSNKAEIFAALKHIGKNYKHVVICGYPPFIKDLVDEGPAEGVRWKTFKSLKFVCAAEMFTEKFRDYLMKKTGIKNPLRDIANIYGSADLGTMAIETPLAILIRRLALKNRRVYKRLFTDANRLPTVAQFHPDFISFEAAGRSLFLTGYNSVPLIRYEIGDHGGVFDFRDAEKVFAIEGINLKAEAKKAGISDSVAELPFVYVYERSDLSTKLYGAIIWPEHVREALMEKGLQKEITGRFTLITKHDGNHNEYLEVNVELRGPKVKSRTLPKRLLKQITEGLLAKNAEYTYLTHHMPTRVIPKIVLWPHEHPLHFRAGTKQKWIKKITYPTMGADELEAQLKLETLLAEAKKNVRPSVPHLYDFTVTDDITQAKGLLKYGVIQEVSDDYEEQLRELFAINNPTLVYAPDFAERFKNYRSELAKQLPEWQQGKWVYYPWRSILVHVLSEPDFFKVRTARNKNLITEEEQKRYYDAVIGVAGLSVGNSVALALIVQGAARKIKLADMDRLALSNTNRIRTGVDSLGALKVEVTARQIYELNPYAEIELFPDGITPENIEKFFDGLDIVIDEIDNLAVKCLIRESAKKHKIAVVMAADNGDNGVVDVERYDLDPNTPFFHNRMGEVSYESLKSLDKFGIGKMITKLVGAENVTLRMQESLLEMGKTIVSWPQLGGAALLNGSAVAFVVRKILNNQPVENNRALISLDEKLIPNYFSPEETKKREDAASVFKETFGL